MVANINSRVAHLAHETNTHLSFNGVRSASSYASSIEQIASSSVFQARPRPKAAWTAVDYAFAALKVIFFPLTLIYYALSYICSCIAFRFGVGATNKIDEAKRTELRELGGQDVAFITEDGLKLEGMHFANPRFLPGSKTILICSGSHASYEAYTVPMVDALLKLGHHVMLFNYREFGKSAGSSSEEGFNLDAEAAYQYLKSVHRKTDDEICAWGYSLGSSPATDLAANHKIKLVLDRYFSSMKDVAYDNGGILAKGIFHLGGAGFDLKEKIKKVTGGIFLARGAQDTTMMPYHETVLQKALAGTHPHFVTVYSGHIHSTSDLWFNPQVGANANQQQRLQRFLQSAL